MLSEVILDDERFEEIVERAKARITDIAPYWTDHNLHDPGITILELFAWLKEMQQFHMDQIGAAHRLAYLRLMGITPRKKKAAKAVVRIDGYAVSYGRRMTKNITNPAFFPQGSRFFAGEICFESVGPIDLSAGEVLRLFVCQDGHNDIHALRTAAGQAAWECGMPAQRECDLHFPAFGAHPQKGSALWMELSGALRHDVTHCLSIRLSEDRGFRRNPIGENDAFYPLAELSLVYHGAQGERRAKIVEDTTHGLLENGMLRFRIEQETEAEGSAVQSDTEQVTMPESGKYYLRLVLDRCEYDMPPILAGISLSEQAVVQQRTIAEYHDGKLCGNEPIRLCTYLAFTGDFLMFRREADRFVLYDGPIEKKISDGEAFFFLKERAEEDMEYRMICYEAGRREALLIGEGSGLPNQIYEPKIADLCADGMCIMMETVKGSGRYLSAGHCDDFMSAGASDAVFFYEEEKGRIRFGDCDHGIAPEGNILFAAARSSLGMNGNVIEGSIRRFEDGKRGIAVKNRHPASGGNNAETPDESRERMIREQTQPARAVTNEDYEQLVRMTPGLMIESVRVIETAITKDGRQSSAMHKGCVTLVVKPCQTKRMPHVSEAYRKNILRALEPKRMLGTRVVVLSPEYIGISVFVEAVVSGQEQRARACMEEAAAGFFDKIRAAFGVSVRVSAIYGMFDVLDVVERVVSLTLDAQGKDIRRSRSGDLILPANGLPYLKECVLSISSDF